MCSSAEGGNRGRRSQNTAGNANGKKLARPRPRRTPRPLTIHHNAAPPIPAPPVPDDQALKASRERGGVGSVVDSCRNVISPKPDENEAMPIPSRRKGVELTAAMRTIPDQLAAVQKRMRRAYRGLPGTRYGQRSLVVREGKILKKATRPLGVLGGTRSSAAERMMT